MKPSRAAAKQAAAMEEQAQVLKAVVVELGKVAVALRGLDKKVSSLQAAPRDPGPEAGD